MMRIHAHKTHFRFQGLLAILELDFGLETLSNLHFFK